MVNTTLATYIKSWASFQKKFETVSFHRGRLHKPSAYHLAQHTYTPESDPNYTGNLSLAAAVDFTNPLQPVWVLVPQFLRLFQLGGNQTNADTLSFANVTPDDEW